ARAPVGTPRGWAGWGRRLAGDGEVGVFEPALALRAAGGLRTVGSVGLAASCGRSAGRAGRLALRRCGRVRGSWPSTSDERASGIETQKFVQVTSNLKRFCRFYVTVCSGLPKT